VLRGVEECLGARGSFCLLLVFHIASISFQDGCLEFAPEVIPDGMGNVEILIGADLAAGHGHKEPSLALNHLHAMNHKAIIEDDRAERLQIALIPQRAYLDLGDLHCRKV
jgi:hypothetical protein